MGALFSTPKKPKPAAPAPSTDTAAVQEAGAEAQRRAALAKGRSSTILASGGLGTVGKA
jgi:hypothetical protein